MSEEYDSEEYDEYGLNSWENGSEQWAEYDEEKEREARENPEEQTSSLELPAQTPEGYAKQHGLPGHYIDNSLSLYDFWEKPYTVERITHHVCGKTWEFKNRRECEAAIGLHEKVCTHVIQGWTISSVNGMDGKHYKDLV